MSYLRKDNPWNLKYEKVWVPGTPAVPARDVVQTRWVQKYRTVIVGPDANGEYYIIQVSDGLVEESYTVHYDAVPATPGYWYLSPTVSKGLNLGWNAGARSVARATGNVQYKFTVLTSAVGIVTGLNDGDTGVGYIEIDHGLAFNLGKFRVIEGGVYKTTAAAYTDTDVFAVVRFDQRVRYYQNGALVYTSLTPSYGSVIADCSLYAGGDTIYDASLSATLDAGFADIVGSAADQFDLVTTALGANVSGWVYDAFDFDVYGFVDNTGEVADAFAETTRALGADAGNTLDSIDFDVNASADLIAPDFAAVDDNLNDLYDAAFGLVGSVGNVADTLEPVNLFSADYNIGQVRDSFEFTSLASDIVIVMDDAMCSDTGTLSEAVVISREYDVEETGTATAAVRQLLAITTTSVASGVGFVEVDTGEGEYVVEWVGGRDEVAYSRETDSTTSGTVTSDTAYTGTYTNAAQEAGTVASAVAGGHTTTLQSTGTATDATAESPGLNVVEAAVATSAAEHHTDVTTMLVSPRGWAKSAVVSVRPFEAATTGIATDAVETQRGSVLVDAATVGSEVPAALVLGTVSLARGRVASALAQGFTTESSATGLVTDAVVDSVSTLVEEHGTVGMAVSQASSLANSAVSVGTASAAAVQSGVLTNLAVAAGTGSATTKSAFAAATVDAVSSGLATSTLASVRAQTASAQGNLTSAIAGGAVSTLAAAGGTLTSAVTSARTLISLAASTGTFSSTCKTTLVGSSLVVESGLFYDYAYGGEAAGAWTTHLETFAMSRYTNYPFTSMAVVDGVLLGTTDLGVMRLDADDDAGVDIDAEVVHDWTDDVPNPVGELRSNEYLKHARYLYTGACASGPMTFGIDYVDRSTGQERYVGYTSLISATDGFVTNKTVLGRGVYSRYLRARLGNAEGSDFNINDATLVVELSSRRI